MLKNLLLVSLLVSAVICGYEQQDQQSYYKTPPPPRILSHKQAQNHDGNFKYAYASENGIAHSEVITPDGNRSGGYTYVDPHGKTITVKYTAGKDGFRILEGNHLPRDPNHPPQPSHQPQAQSQYNGPSYQPHYSREEDNDDGQYRPEQYERPEPTYAKAAPQYQPPAYHQPQQQQQQQKSYSSSQPTSFYEAQSHYKPIEPISYRPQPAYKPEPRYDAPQPRYQPQEHHSNNVEDKQSDYHDDPGKPHTFGTGYAFQFSS